MGRSWTPLARRNQAAGRGPKGVKMSMLNTLKTTLGFLSTLITRFTPLDLSGDSLEGIFNLLRIDGSTLTSGQPTEKQFEFIRDAGIRHVINLAPDDAENALRDEPGVLANLGIEYVHIPVDFRKPTEADFDQFCRAMSDVGDAPLLVHCAANMRVSAFMYRYRRDVLKQDPEEAARDLHRIWQPFGVWKDFVRADASG